MQSQILNKKRTISVNGEDIIDLTTKSIEYSDIEDPIVIDRFYVGEDMVMRPDMLSWVGYGNTDNYDIILKFNGISNPFSLDANTFILIPELQYMNDATLSPSNIDYAADVIKQYIDPSKAPSKDPTRAEFDQAMQQLKKKTEGANFVDYPLPPNFAQPGSKEGRINGDGTITLGADV